MKNADNEFDLENGDLRKFVEFQIDEILGERYRVLGILGVGGMGVVYKVEQIFLGKELALKTIHKSALNEGTIRRFQAEAKAAFAVNHPNIISVHDFGLLDEETPFLAMEIVQGKTLASILKKKPLSIDEAIPIFIQVCFGLAHAHENGVIHRDIKPSNIMLLDQLSSTTEGSVKILDFGIAKLMQHEGGEIQSLTRTGEIFGSPLYMSPEQCNGDRVDHRADVYSLGCVLFEALTGTTPFVGDNALSTMMMHQAATIPSLREASLGNDFPKELEQVVKGLLAKNPNERYQNLGQTAHDLAAIRRGDIPLHSTHLPSVQSRPLSKDVTDKITLPRKLFWTILVANAVACSVFTALIVQAVR